MIKIDHTEVVGWEAAIRGMRNPMNSWEQSDSGWCYFSDSEPENFFHEYDEDTWFKVIGTNDLSLMQKLCKAGSDHRKFMRMLVVYCDITAPLYWWKEFDTYKVGTVANSCSTMHKIHAKEFTPEDFSYEHLGFDGVELLLSTITLLNRNRKFFIETKEKKYWWQMIQLLPTSYEQKRTVMLNYEVLTNIYHARRNHKLDEWHDFCKWIESLPYSELITRKGDKDG